MTTFRAAIFLLGLHPGLMSAANARLEAAVHTRAAPNVIFILADDLGFGDLSVQGGKSVSTPNLDRLAAEGVRFTQFYANAPICSPSRVSFITGQYPQRWKITSAIAYRRENRARDMADFLPADAPSFARLLQQAGYATAHFGKWHLGGGRDIGEAPLVAQYGFDQVLTQFEGLGDRILPIFSRPMRPRWGTENRHPLGVESSRLGHGEVEFVERAGMTERWVNRTIAFIKESRARQKPFYVNVWPDDPHTPVEPSVTRRGDGSTSAAYQAVVEELDRDIGKLIDFIRADPELRANTLIVFASDNGPEEGFGSSGGFRGTKTTLYEGGIRVPLIVWSPGFMPGEAAGATDNQSVIVGMDLAPTVLSLTGVSGEGSAFDGQDMSQVWLGKPSSTQRTVVWTRPPDQPGKNGEMPDIAVRRGDWKLLLYDKGGPPELYDLSKDPEESKNLADLQPEVVADLRLAATDWRKKVGQ